MSDSLEATTPQTFSFTDNFSVPNYTGPITTQTITHTLDIQPFDPSLGILVATELTVTATAQVAYQLYAPNGGGSAAGPNINAYAPLFFNFASSTSSGNALVPPGTAITDSLVEATAGGVFGNPTNTTELFDASGNPEANPQFLLLDGIQYGAIDPVSFPITITNLAETNDIQISVQYLYANLFTSGSDVVDFNNLTTNQQTAVVGGADLYHGLGGNDTVTLPSAANYNEVLVGINDTLGWNPSSTFFTGSLAGDVYHVVGSDGNYNIVLGAGTDTVTINGDGDSSITAGSATDTISITGNGDNTVSAGAGADTITVSGNGSNTVTLGAGSDSVLIKGDGSNNITAGSGHDVITINGNGDNTITPGSGSESISINGTGTNSVLSGDLSEDSVIEITGGGRLKITGDADGDLLVGNNSTAEVVGSDTGFVTLEGSATTVVLDQPGNFSGNIEGLSLGDKIDLAKTEVVSAVLSGNSLSITEADQQVFTYQVSGDLSAKFFEATDDGNGGTLLTLVNLPSFKITTASPGSGAYASSVVVTEGSDSAGQIKVALSSAVDVPIDVHVDLQPTGWEDDVSLADFVIPAGVSSFTAPIVTPLDDDETDLESIESGNLVLSATAQGTSLPFSGTDDSAQLLVQDQINSGNAATLAGYQTGLTTTKNVIKYIKDTTVVSYALETDTSVAAAKYVSFLKGAAQIAGVVIDGTKVQLQLQSDLQTAAQISDPNAQAQAAYAAYENAQVTYLNSLFKSATIASGAAFTAGVVAGLTGVAVTAALPVLATVAIGWTATLAYDAYIAPIVKSTATSAFEADNPKADFINSYIEAHQTNNVDILIHGYIAGATIFEDVNGTGQLAANDPSTTTDASGHFTPLGNTGSLIAFGGTDISTGLSFKGQFSAPAGSGIISPLTTLLNDLQSDPAAQQKILSSLGLSPELNLSSFDPIASAQGGSADGAATAIAGAKVYDTAEIIASALAGTGSVFKETLQTAFSSLASALDGAGVNLSDKASLTGLIVQIAKTENISMGSGAADSIASVVAAGNAALDNVLQTDQPGAKLLADAAGVELVMEGAASTAITNAADNPSQLQAVANLFTGQNLEALIAQAQSETQNPGQDLGPIAIDGTAVTDQNVILKGSVVAVDLVGNSIQYTLDGTGPAGLTFNTDGTFSFDPGQTYKYLAPGESTTLSFQFTASDGQGTPSSGKETITIDGVDTTAPVLTPIANETVHATSAAGAAVVFSVTASDAVDGTVPVVFEENNTIVHSGDVFALGSHVINASATDAAGNSASETFVITVADLAPIVSALSDTVQQNGPAFSQNLLAGASDADAGDTLSVAGLDATLTTEGGRTLVLGTDYTLNNSIIALTSAGFAKFESVAASQTDHVVIHYDVSDGILTTADTLTLTIDGTNDAPVIANQTHSQTATSGTPFVLTLPSDTFQDPDNGDHLTLTASLSNGTPLPSWLTFDAATGTLKGTPSSADAGNFGIAIHATDTGGLSATDTFQLSVSGGIDHAPVITSDGGGAYASIIIGDETRYVDKVQATDPDPGTNINYSIIGGEDQNLFKIDPVNGDLSFKSLPKDGHSYQVEVAASDGTKQDVQTIDVQVAKGIFEFGNAKQADNFVFKPDFGLEIVNNFDAKSSNHDVLELDHTLFHGASSGESANSLMNLIDHHSFQFGPDLLILTDTHDVIDLRNTNLHSLAAKDFLLT